VLVESVAARPISRGESSLDDGAVCGGNAGNIPRYGETFN
jgi:hypothetical protein